MGKAFFPVVVLASDLAIPTFIFAHDGRALLRDQMRAGPSPQQAGSERTTGGAQYAANILIALKSAAARQQAFASYDSVNSSSAA